MPALVDTTIRLLSQEPLAGRMPTADLLRLAELLDGAGFAYLEVSGGGVFDTAVRRGVESPWERIRALKARTKTPLGMALRGRFSSARARRRRLRAPIRRERGRERIDVFRLEDPLNDVSNLREAGEAIVAAEREFDAGLIYSPGQGGETKHARRAGEEAARLGAARVLLHHPSGALQPHRANELVDGARRASGLPVGLYCQGAGGQRSRGGARGGASRSRPRRVRRLSDRAGAPPGLGRSARERAHGLGMDSGVNVETRGAQRRSWTSSSATIR